MAINCPEGTLICADNHSWTGDALHYARRGLLRVTASLELEATGGLQESYTGRLLAAKRRARGD
jgi:hypothetical protein